MNNETQEFDIAVMNAVDDYLHGNKEYDKETVIQMQIAVISINMRRISDIIEIIISDIRDNKQKIKQIENITSEFKVTQKSLCKVVEAIMSDLEE